MAARARVVLLAAEGLADRRIAVVARMHHNRVAVWRRRFAALGLAGLDDVPRPGRPPARGEEQLLAAAGRLATGRGEGRCEHPAALLPSASAGAWGDGSSSAGQAARHWRARRALERAADGSDLVSRLLAEQDAGTCLILAGVLLAPRASAIAVVCCSHDIATSDVRSVRRPIGSANVIEFVAAVTRAWRGNGRVHVLIEERGRQRRRSGARPAARSDPPADAASGDPPLRIYVAGSRPAWTVQAELMMVLAGQSAADAPFGGLELLRDHGRRTPGEALACRPQIRPRVPPPARHPPARVPGPMGAAPGFSVASQGANSRPIWWHEPSRRTTPAGSALRSS